MSMEAVSLFVGQQLPRVLYVKYITREPGAELLYAWTQTTLSHRYTHTHTFQSNDFAGWIHDGWVSWDGSANWVCSVIHVNDNHLSCLAHLLPYTNELVRLHSKSTEPNIGRIDANILELQAHVNNKFLLIYTQQNNEILL